MGEDFLLDHHGQILRLVQMLPSRSEAIFIVWKCDEKRLIFKFQMHLNKCDLAIIDEYIP